MSSWAPHIFRNEGKSIGYDSDYLDAVVSEGNRLNDLGLPILFTLGHLAHICDVPYGFLEKSIRRKSDDNSYRVFKIRKRLGGYRHITVPCDSLLKVQRWIHKNVLSIGL
jgi:RNA-directed DNA polymerase